MSANRDNEDDSSYEESEAELVDDGAADEWEQVEAGETQDTDDWVQIQQSYYDSADEAELTTALVSAIAEAKDVDPLNHSEMPSLYDSIDAQALEETFFGPSEAEIQREEGSIVTFIYEGYKVALRADGWIFVYEQE